jgi:hypothetical protein
MLTSLLRNSCSLAAVAFTLAACNPQTSTVPAEQGVALFHARLDAGKFNEIYSNATPEFQKTTTPKDLEALLSAVHRKLGTSSPGTKQTWHVNFGTAGTIVTLTYKTQFSEGMADEKFVFRLENDGASLMGYNVNSPVFVLK